MQNASTSTRPEVNRTTDTRLTDASMHSHERSDRLFSLSGLWYFRTREGKDVGPFRYRCEAESMLSRFIDETSRQLQSSMMPHKLHFRTCGVIGSRQAS
ncbi:hypothetical protein PHACT_00565 [Pseudohongiella acticola]|jgi:Domain of unknown function (DUF6316)|uniref:DUF6316 domain-containing protein n=1 Tax=Pseudohongiella acticola TaxID=1524254 RepID=A0A1E8CHC3_9GAMM|nr:DUF6316 family protein [Pseudohongiella acticola]OFE11824.1 hypothetical protein PHACT_00565 [Pseudohongiella acticola]|tara:strand:+ start:282 stop:578 length:297 start_codon:yes stop_codon:yes gene_type:complete